MKLRVGILGYGYMGEIRRRVLQEIPKVDLVAICEANESKLLHEEPIKVCRTPADFWQTGLDAVFVCTPNNLIPDLAVEALSRGLHVFCEKPPGKNYEDILRIRAKELESPGKKLMFGFNHRYHPGILKAKKLIDSGQFGKLLWLRGVYGKSGGKNYAKSWRNKKDVAGGGILLDQGIHMLDLFNLFAGGLEEVKAMVTESHWKFGIEDNAFVILKNRDNVHAMLHSSATQWKHTFELNIGLELGQLIIQGLLSKSGSYGRETLVIRKRQFEDESEAVGNPMEQIVYFDKDDSWRIEVETFVDAIEHNREIKGSSSQEALAVMKLVRDAYQSSENG